MQPARRRPGDRSAPASRQHRPSLLLLLGAALSSTPGCLTAHMWSTYEPDWRSTTITHDRAVRIRHGALICEEPAGAIVWTHDGGATGPAARVELVPATGKASSLRTVLEHDAFVIDEATLDSHVEIVDGDPTSQRSTVTVTFRLAHEALGKRLTSDVLPAVSRQRLRRALPGNLLDPEPRTYALQRLMPRALGLGVGWRLASWFRCDHDLMPSGDRPPTMPLSEHAPASHEADVRVVARFEHGAQSCYGCMPWRYVELFARCELAATANSDTSCRYTESFVRRTDRRARTDATSYAHLGPLAERLHLDRGHTVHATILDRGLLGRVLATPVTLAADLVLGPGLLNLVQRLSGDSASTDQQDTRGGRDP